jgi:hypothetical protein
MPSKKSTKARGLVRRTKATAARHAANTKKVVKSRRKESPRAESELVPEGFKRLPLTGAIVPIDYNPHGGRRRVGGRSVTARVPVDKAPSLDSDRKPGANSLAGIAAGAVGKRPATGQDVHDIIEMVRNGKNPSAIVTTVYLSHEQRQAVSAAHRKFTARSSDGKKAYFRRRNRAAQDIFRKGIRVSGSFQSRC